MAMLYCATPVVGGGRPSRDGEAGCLPAGANGGRGVEPQSCGCGVPWEEPVECNSTVCIREPACEGGGSGPCWNTVCKSEDLAVGSCGRRGKRACAVPQDNAVRLDVSPTGTAIRDSQYSGDVTREIDERGGDHSGGCLQKAGAIWEVEDAWSPCWSQMGVEVELASAA